MLGEQFTAGAPWGINLKALPAQIVPGVPDGWVSPDEAATALGAARRTVLRKVQRGRLNATHVNRGRRKGLCIEGFFPDGPGLFDEPR